MVPSYCHFIATHSRYVVLRSLNGLSRNYQEFVVPVPGISVSGRTALNSSERFEHAVSDPDLASMCTAASPSESPRLRTKLCFTRRIQIQRQSNTRTQISTHRLKNRITAYQIAQSFQSVSSVSVPGRHVCQLRIAHTRAVRAMLANQHQQLLPNRVFLAVGKGKDVA